MEVPEWHAAAPDATKFPPAFRAFLAENGISVDNYALSSEVLRYVRVNPRSEPSAVSAERLRELLGDTCAPVPWLPGFFSLSSGVKIASSSLYTDSHIYGIDAASGAAVTALDAREGESVLDLCCAPGAKLCMLAEAVGPTGSVTGVDVAAHRLAACRTMCTKYALEHVRLFLGDGAAFAEPPPPPCADATAAGADVRRAAPQRAIAKRRREAAGAASSTALSAPALLFHAGALLRSPTPPLAANGAPAADGAPAGAGCRRYDRVIVDAECTHDGSIKHLSKFAAWGWDTFEKRFLDPARLSTLEALQRSLLAGGFGCLREGGSLVYSTCSFARRQNEDVVSWLLEREPTARCVPLASLAAATPSRPGSLEHTVRFEPCASRTSALFIAKIERGTSGG
jgi:16S rRNA C967 or C1407 C5-methylase (RsmB/RsmF family)